MEWEIKGGRNLKPNEEGNTVDDVCEKQSDVKRHFGECNYNLVNGHISIDIFLQFY